MPYTETKTTGYGSRLSSSFKSIGFGFILIIIATVLLWRNEGNTVRTAHDIKEVGNNATHVDNIQTVAPEGKLIHANGIAKTGDMLTDPEFKLSVNALCLEREVKYYQWVEHAKVTTRDKMGGSQEEETTYTYQCEWVNNPVESKDFHDPQYRYINNNIATPRIHEHSVYASNISFGAYRIPESFIKSVAHCASKEYPQLNIDPEILKSLNKSMGEAQTTGSRIKSNISKMFGSGNDSTSYEWVHVSGNEIYLGQSASSPNAGDMRIIFTAYQPSAEISLVAVVKGNSFTEYQTKNNNKTNYIMSGTKTLEEMMQSAEESNEMWTWGFRILGVILVCLAFKMLFGFLVTLLKVVPFLASILNWGISIICTILGLVYSIIIIAVAWIFYRPLLGACLIALAAGIAGGLIYWGATRKKKETATESI